MSYNAFLPDLSLPQDVTIDTIVLEACRMFKGKTAYYDEADRHLTFEDLEHAIVTVARNLRGAWGLNPGDVVAVYLPNCLEYPVVLLGALYAGATVSTINPSYSPRELAHHLKDSSPHYVVTTPALRAGAKEAAAASHSPIRKMFFTGEQFDDELLSSARAAEHPALPTDVAARYGSRSAFDAASRVAFLPYSSGTTGLSKGVMLTHRSVVANIFQIAALQATPAAWEQISRLRLSCAARELLGTPLGIDCTSVLVHVLPYFHIYGLVVLLLFGLVTGASGVIMARFELERYLSLAEGRKATHLHVVPPIAIALAKHPAVAQHNLTSVKYVMSGAAPLGGETEKLLADRLGVIVRQGYGMTELSPVSHLCRADRVVPGACGVLVPNTEARLVDPSTGKDVDVLRMRLPPGCATLNDVPLGDRLSGELLIRGPQVMQGYHNNLSATAATIDADGWLHTGDIATVDAAGEHFFIVDRLKELIKVKGFQVPPAELESLLVSQPAIADAAVIGLPDVEGDRGEIVKAYIVMKSEFSAADAAGAVRAVNAAVVPFKHIQMYDLVLEIPKSPSGKILRRVLRNNEGPARVRQAKL
eukprot:TRINITY_DN2569_c0_g2_i1.p1 TRINITY_DN2569_c0_g2~~TRINITY_DN2569_c0_g2_i1.p1  ORF type:complete len:589 (+),score=51.75 TRINITY_DN2569_c0_g2_i1:127-1893(+)